MYLPTYGDSNGLLGLGTVDRLAFWANFAFIKTRGLNLQK